MRSVNAKEHVTFSMIHSTTIQSSRQHSNDRVLTVAELTSIGFGMVDSRYKSHSLKNPPLWMIWLSCESQSLNVRASNHSQASHALLTWSLPATYKSALSSTLP